MDTNLTSRITKEERARRQKAVNTARDSVGLEGFEISPEVTALNARYVTGELTSEELDAEITKTIG